MADENSEGDDANAAYKRRIEELQKRQQAEAQLKAIVGKLFEPAAIERLNNIRISNQELYLQIVQVFFGAYQQGQINGKVNEEQVKAVASKILSQRRSTTIRRA